MLVEKIWKNKAPFKKDLIWANVIILAYLSPLIILGQDVHIGISDQLDSHIIWYKILKKGGYIFVNSHTPIPEIMSAPRLSFYNEFYLLFWLHYIFDTFPAIVINKFIIHFAAFWGMCLLLRELKMSRQVMLISGLFFAFLPHVQYWGLSISGQPLVLFALLRISNEGLKLKYILICLIYTLYSNFYSVSFFFLAGLSIYMLVDFVKAGKINWHLTGVICIMVFLALLMEYRLIYNILFNSDYISNRVERYFTRASSFFPFQSTLKLLFLGHYTAYSGLILYIPFLCVVTWLSYKKNQIIKKRVWLISIVSLLMISLLEGLRQSKWFIDLYHNYFFLRVFNFGRAFTLFPLISVLLGASALQIIRNYLPKFKIIYGIWAVMALSCLLFLNPTYDSLFKIYRKDESKISYKAFYAENLFEKIKEYIGEKPSTYKVASLGIHPAVAQYNGFYTIDGYLTNYPLEYKRKFRKIIQDELDQNPEIKSHFDNWGSRCYLFDNQIGPNFLNTKDKIQSIDLLNINCEAFKKLEGKFLLSTVKIENFSCPKMIIFYGVFEDENWKIYLYEIQ